MKHIFLGFLSVCLLGLAAIAVAIGFGIHSYTGAGPLSENKIVLIERGQGVGQIAEKLAQENVISQGAVFKIAARFNDSLKAGEYEFPARVSMAETIEMMAEGAVFDRKITIAEGLTVQQIIKRLKAREDLSGDIKQIPKEGTLLPDTYHFVKNENRQDILNRMQTAMREAIDTAWENRAAGLPVTTKDEAIILASIVEKETGVAKEREKVAGVFVNRLKIGMALQTDPTVIYAITKGDIKEDGMGPLGRRLLRKDLEIDSPYNTYKYPGLPPGPIANPGRAAIEATLNPAEHDYIYFVADGTGGHAFAKTLAGHNKNVAEWRKVRD